MRTTTSRGLAARAPERNLVAPPACRGARDPGGDSMLSPPLARVRLVRPDQPVLGLPALLVLHGDEGTEVDPPLLVGRVAHDP